MIERFVGQVAVRERAEHAEGPLWDDRTDELFWIDQYIGAVRAAHRAGNGSLTRTREFSIGAPVGAIVPRADNGWMLAARDGFLRLHEDGRIEPVAEVLPRDGVRRRMNDGKVDAAGRFWAGSMAFDKTEGAGALYTLDRGVVRTAIASATISNGLAWSATGDVLYYIDTPTAVIRRFDLEAGFVAAGGENAVGTVVATAPSDGGFDGMCIDVDGCLWVAVWGAGEVRRYSPGGELLAVVSVDAPQVSSCAFGGPQLDTLYITTSREGYGTVEDARHPLAGCIFEVTPGVRGMLAERYRD